MGKGTVLDGDGADGGGRTHTSLRIQDFESSASANSATSATVYYQHLLSGNANHVKVHVIPPLYTADSRLPSKSFEKFKKSLKA